MTTCCTTYKTWFAQSLQQRFHWRPDWLVSFGWCTPLHFLWVLIEYFFSTSIVTRHMVVLMEILFLRFWLYITQFQVFRVTRWRRELEKVYKHFQLEKEHQFLLTNVRNLLFITFIVILRLRQSDATLWWAVSPLLFTNAITKQIFTRKTETILEPGLLCASWKSSATNDIWSTVFCEANGPHGPFTFNKGLELPWNHQ